MKKLFLLTMMALALLGTSCGGGSSKSAENSAEKQESKITVESPKIGGPLGNYFEVVARDYDVKEGFSQSVNFEIKRTQEGLPGITQEEASMIAMSEERMGQFEIEIKVELLDANNNLLDDSSLSINEQELFGLGVGETVFGEGYFHEVDLSKVATVRFKSSFKIKDNIPQEATPTTDEVTEQVEDKLGDIEKAARGLEAIGNAYKAFGEAAREVENMR